MQKVSSKYKEGMKKIVRERSYIRAHLGVIHQEAQRTAIAPTGLLAYYANNIKPLNQEPVTVEYATCEHNFALADGRFVFLPSNNDYFYNAGLVNKDFMTPIVITFPTTYTIKGLTIKFGSVFPVNFTIQGGTTTLTIINNERREFVTQEVFTDASSIIITPSLMSNGTTARLRIETILMGIGITFTNKDVITSSLKMFASPISEELPSCDFTLSVDNTLGKFDIEDPNSAINFLESGQQCTVEYGFETDDGIEWVKGGVLSLRSWSSDDDIAKFTASALISYMSGTFLLGRYYSSGISLYDLAWIVINDSGEDPDMFEVDPYLKTVYTKNPIPKVKHSEALQLIANAGRCAIIIDRDGKTKITASFTPVITITSGTNVTFGNVSTLLGKEKSDHIAMGSQNSTKADGSAYFHHNTQQPKDIGYISLTTSSPNGIMSMTALTINLEAAISFHNMRFLLGDAIPKVLNVTTSLAGVVVEDLTFDVDRNNFIAEHEFLRCDRIVIKTPAASPNSRLVIDSVSIGDVTDYTLERSVDLTASPKGTKVERIKNLAIGYDTYTYGLEEKELVNSQVDGSIKRHSFTFSNPAHGLRCELVGGTSGQSITIVNSSAYYVEVQLNGTFTDVANIKVYGTEFYVSTSEVKKELSQSGVSWSWSNPLISSRQVALNVLNWTYENLSSDVEYDIPYRGDPRIDANDILFLSHRTVDNFKIKASEHTVDFNGSLSGKIKARRIGHVDNTQS